MEGIDKSLPTFESLGLNKQKPLEKPRLGQEDFMNLMMAQIKHQDPMKPMENGDFISQMAEFSSVSGLKELKDSFNTLANALQSSQALQASSMVGRQVLVPGDVAELNAQGGIRGSVDVPHAAEKVTVKIFNKSGAQVAVMDLGPQRPGSTQFNWDGVIKKMDEMVPPVEGMQPENQGVRADAGVYSVKAEAIIEGKPTAIQTFTVDKVDSVSLASDKQGVTLNLKHAGATLLSDVQEII
ncbi:Flagellar basal-body rod modification protein FlgD [hydrothermal vent metagenome]|uniref:Flagellar basal-body rod modification protein FlgD n=1 Tax=hydrothermal vent metagenome TaxID=652676 RepID=A0A3B1A9M7_9ZZZZ